MNLNNIKFSSYQPSYERYFDQDLKDPSITQFVHFTKGDATLIFDQNYLVGAFKVMEREEQKGDREIWIGILPQYRQNGIASYVLKTVIHNIFSSDLNCQDIHLSIDKENIASIHLALHCGFIENKELE